MKTQGKTHGQRVHSKGRNRLHEDLFSCIYERSLPIIMALVAHFDLDLHQMDVKATFLNDGLKEEVYMK